MSSQDDLPTNTQRTGNLPGADVSAESGQTDAKARATGGAAGFDPDAVMRRVRAELARRGVATGSVADAEADSADLLERWRPAAPRLSDKEQFVLADFLGFDDADFVDVAYRKLLWRPAGDGGSRAYLEALRGGAVSKVEILGRIRFSDEGRQRAVHVDGLLLPYKLHRWRRLPVVGFLLGLAMAVGRLPRLAWHLQRLEATAARESHEIGRLLNRRSSELQALQLRADEAQDQLRQHIDGVEDEMCEVLAKSDRAQQLRLDAQDVTIGELRGRVDDRQRRLRNMLERLTVFLDVSARQARDGDAKAGSESEPERQYAAFEDAFRGARGEIKLRVAHYLETLVAAGIKPGDTDAVLDLGSGRGEWLEVLAEHGYRGLGVDLNPGMLKASQDRGHDVVEANALDYLRAQDDNRFAAVTAMHLVEHIPHAALIELLDQALRVLRPGGVLILETPNPENVLVGACYFYMDPTHRNPIPPLLLQWTVQARGFEGAAIERLSEHRGPPSLVPVPDDVAGAAQINQMVAWFTASPDYAVIARKPVAPA